MGNRLSINDFVRIKLPEYFHISLIFSIFMVENSLVWLMVSLKFEYMFELLLIIYLVPVIIILSLLWRLVLWLVRNVLRLAGWLLKKVCVLVWKGLLLLVGIFLGRCCVPSAGFKIRVKQQSRTCLGRAGTASCCSRVERCSSLMSGVYLTDKQAKILCLCFFHRQPLFDYHNF